MIYSKKEKQRDTKKQMLEKSGSLPVFSASEKKNNKRRKYKLQRLNTIEHSFLNDLVTPVIREPEKVFDFAYFGNNSQISMKDEFSRNHEDTLMLLRSNKEKHMNDPKLFKSYSTDTLSEDEFVCDFKLVSAGNLISKSKSKPCEDAYFTHSKAVGIADGVGGWARFGIDCSKFSNELMKRCLIFCKNFEKMRKFTIDLVRSTEFQSNFGDIYKSIASEMKARRLHSNSFCNLQQGGESLHSKSNSSKDIFNDSMDILSDKSQKTNRVKSPFSLDPKIIIKDSCTKMKHCGSSTICVATVQNRHLRVANLGDSGMLLLRYNTALQQSRVILCTKDQNHAFNTPFQVAKIPADCYKLFKTKESSKVSKETNTLIEQTFYNDPPESADTYQARLNLNDIVILGTDGLFDNLFLDDILDVVDDYVTDLLKDRGLLRPIDPTTLFTNKNTFTLKRWFTETDAKELSIKLSKAARSRSKSFQVFSPFEKKCNDFLETTSESRKSTASARTPEISLWQGGKKDDIGVVVAFVC